MSQVGSCRADRGGPSEGLTRGAFALATQALPLLNDGASIVLVGSVSGCTSAPGFSVYGASKAAVSSFAARPGRFATPLTLPTRCRVRRSTTATYAPFIDVRATEGVPSFLDLLRKGAFGGSN
ncbi:SDR family NAD(P)-dependent oxidoreductase [Streptomyces afghaniensis]|uniref:SDR family NAD(P)-dependent oxidoreductase n=1 Tax=Streptomyces afghaniensis TaxID=66865 RepID=UPI0037D094BD